MYYITVKCSYTILVRSVTDLQIIEDAGFSNDGRFVIVAEPL